MAEKKVNTSNKNELKSKGVLNLSIDDTFMLDDLENRRLYLNEEVNNDIIDSIVYNIMKFNRQDKNKPVNKRQPILLYLNTPGGSTPDGFGLIDAIITSKTPVYTINQAMCASMGFLIYIAGSKRYSMPHAEFLLHDGNEFSWDSTAKAIDRMKFVEGELEAMVKQYVLKYTNISSEIYDQNYRKEWYFLPNKGKELGVVDYIVGQDCDIDEIL